MEKISFLTSAKLGIDLATYARKKKKKYDLMELDIH